MDVISFAFTSTLMAVVDVLVSLDSSLILLQSTACLLLLLLNVPYCAESLLMNRFSSILYQIKAAGERVLFHATRSFDTSLMPVL